MPLNLTPDKAFIFRITHISNVPWILDHGLHCTSSEVHDPAFRPIGDPDLIKKRAVRAIPPPWHGTISDYVTFYFTPLSPMLLNIRTGYRGIEKLPMSDIAIIVSSLPMLASEGIDFVFSDCHAYLAEAQFSSDLANLHRIDWDILCAHDFQNTIEDQGKMQRYQAEALVREHVPVAALHGIACHGQAECGRIQEEVDRRGLDLKVIARPGWFF